MSELSPSVEARFRRLCEERRSDVDVAELTLRLFATIDRLRKENALLRRDQGGREAPRTDEENDQ